MESVAVARGSNESMTRAASRNGEGVLTAFATACRRALAGAQRMASSCGLNVVPGTMATQLKEV
jgi:hypothetical protein